MTHVTSVAGCPVPPEPVELRPGECVHTKQPEGYLPWHAWAKLASKTHHQIKCPTCLLYQIWIPKKWQ